MRIAVLSDIHGNFTAFQAVTKDIKKKGIDKVIIAGDNIVDCTEPNEVLNNIKSMKAYVIKGNREQYILDYHNGKKNEWKDHKQMGIAIWTHNELTAENINYIEKLPEQLSISLAQMDDIRVVHGSPSNMSEELFPDKDIERLKKAISGIKESVLICGHTHESWSKKIDNKLVVNPGSVGVPFNEFKAAEYAILTWEDHRWIASHHKVKYNMKDLEQLFKKSEIMKECRAWSKLTLKSIEEGRNVTMDFIQYAYKLAEESGIRDLKLVPNFIWDEAEELWFSKYIEEGDGI